MAEAPEKYALDNLLYLMKRLRDPSTGCPWDIKQDFQSITASTIEEAYEVVDAIEHKDYAHLKEELGDLLFQVIFYSQLADEQQLYDFNDVVDGLTAKLVRRHPHVFPDGTLESRRAPGVSLDDSDIKASWENIKQQERASKGSAGVFDDLPVSLPPLIRAEKLQKRAAKLGFDWENTDQVLDKLGEELTELCEAVESKNMDHVANELGDLMFTCVNLSRHIHANSEALMRAANRKFETRFAYVVNAMAQDKQESFTAHELESFWDQAKKSGL